MKPETVDPKTKAVESKTNISVRKTVKHKDGEVEILERNCIYCGNHLRATYFREGKGPQQMQISCPSDGFVELRNAG